MQGPDPTQTVEAGVLQGARAGCRLGHALAGAALQLLSRVADGVKRVGGPTGRLAARSGAGRGGGQAPQWLQGLQHAS